MSTPESIGESYPDLSPDGSFDSKNAIDSLNLTKEQIANFDENQERLYKTVVDDQNSTEVQQNAFNILQKIMGDLYASSEIGNIMQEIANQRGETIDETSGLLAELDYEINYDEEEDDGFGRFDDDHFRDLA